MTGWRVLQCVNGPYDGMTVRVEGFPDLVYIEPVESLANLIEEFLKLRIRREVAVYHLRTSRGGKMYYEFHEIRELAKEV